MRSIEEIYNSLVAAKDSDPVLSPLLTSSSATAIWKAIFYIISVGVWIHEGLFDTFKSEITEIANNAYAGTIAWYYRKALDFQYGYSVEFMQDGQIGYSNIDENAKIIKHVAIVETGNILLVKVSKANMLELSINEEAAFVTYLNKIKFAGTKTAVVNIPADTIIADIDIYYDPQLLSSVGESLNQPGVYPVQTAIATYMESIQFGGSLVKTQMIDYIQAAEGVCDITLNSISAKKHLGGYNVIASNAYNSLSGKILVDQLHINYTPCNII